MENLDLLSVEPGPTMATIGDNVTAWDWSTTQAFFNSTPRNFDSALSTLSAFSADHQPDSELASCMGSVWKRVSAGTTQDRLSLLDTELASLIASAGRRLSSQLPLCTGLSRGSVEILTALLRGLDKHVAGARAERYRDAVKQRNDLLAGMKSALRAGVNTTAAVLHRAAQERLQEERKAQSEAQAQASGPQCWNSPHCTRGATTGSEGALKLLTCSRCKEAAYCSQVCQRIHWRVHKLRCLPPGGTGSERVVLDAPANAPAPAPLQILNLEQLTAALRSLENPRLPFTQALAVLDGVLSASSSVMTLDSLGREPEPEPEREPEPSQAQTQAQAQAQASGSDTTVTQPPLSLSTDAGAQAAAEQSQGNSPPSPSPSSASTPASASPSASEPAPPPMPEHVRAMIRAAIQNRRATQRNLAVWLVQRLDSRRHEDIADRVADFCYQRDSAGAVLGESVLAALLLAGGDTLLELNVLHLITLLVVADEGRALVRGSARISFLLRQLTESEQPLVRSLAEEALAACRLDESQTADASATSAGADVEPQTQDQPDQPQAEPQSQDQPQTESQQDPAPAAESSLAVVAAPVENP